MLFISLFTVFAANLGKLIINLQRYYKKCTYASKHDEFLQKKSSFFIIRRNMPIMLAWNRRIETDDKCASIEEIRRACLAKILILFFGGNPPRRGRGVPKKAHTRAVVCAAFCERTFEVGERSEVGALEVLQKIFPSEGTHPIGEGACRKNAHTQASTTNFFKKRVLFLS